MMDGDDVSQAEFTACMKDLAAVNTLTLARRPTLDFIGRALSGRPRRTRQSRPPAARETAAGGAQRT